MFELETVQPAPSPAPRSYEYEAAAQPAAPRSSSTVLHANLTHPPDFSSPGTTITETNRLSVVGSWDYPDGACPTLPLPGPLAVQCSNRTVLGGAAYVGLYT